ncbi:GNAT family N-acetyltransferase [Microvirga sp. 2MCAF38]|uniref:GNAT family N-acetyltransferase n=1 Tax=Microvirga sp. 2MCAF38 TaxID=3232989 RepID=UPI003F9C0A53
MVWLRTYAKSGLRNALSDYVLAEFTPEKIAASISNEKQVLIVYEENVHLLGYLRLALDSPCPNDPATRVEIVRLYVQEHFIGRGIGSALLKNALTYCDKNGSTGVWLAVNHENTHALRFYEQHRFLRSGSTFFHLENERHENFILYKPISLSASANPLISPS